MRMEAVVTKKVQFTNQNKWWTKAIFLTLGQRDRCRNDLVEEKERRILFTEAIQMLMTETEKQGGEHHYSEKYLEKEKNKK